MAKVKVCGLSRLEDIGYCNELKPDYIGFILDFPKSRRNVPFEQARLLKSHLDSSIEAVGVFVDSPVDTVANLCREGTVDVVQLHGNEGADYILELRSKVSNPIVKAVRVQSAEEVLQADALPCDYLLLDTYVPNTVGGSGLTFDWSIVPPTTKQYFLAGGLTSENVQTAVATCHPYAVDVSSSVEVDGVKSYDRVREFIAKVRER
jgi:phosphoribosylanthranilate isomerase